MLNLKDVGRKTKKLLRTIGEDLVNSASMIKDLFVDLLQFVGVGNFSRGKSTDLRSRIDKETAAANLRRAEKSRDRKELVQRLKFQKLLKKRGKKYEALREDVRSDARSVSRGPSVSHLAKMQQQSRNHKAVDRPAE